MHPIGGNTMRTFVVLSFITAIFLLPMTTEAEAECLLCGVSGFAQSSASNNEQAGTTSGSNVIYVAPHISKRIADPLAVRIAVSAKMGFLHTPRPRRNITEAQGMTLQEMFESTVPNHENFTILKITQVILPGKDRIAVFWFSYIENEKMRPHCVS